LSKKKESLYSKKLVLKGQFFAIDFWYILLYNGLKYPKNLKIFFLKFQGGGKEEMKKIIVCFLILAMAIVVIPASSFAFRGHGGYYRGGHGGYGGYYRGGNFWPVVIYPPCYIAPAPVYVVPSTPCYRSSYDQAYERETERLRQEEYRERQRLQAEQERFQRERAREDARRDFYGGDRR
jgi:hypothetical protein